MRFDQLSNHTPLSMTLLHGRLLHDCGYTKLVSMPSLSGNWGLTGMWDRRGLSYRSPTRTGRWSSGRPAMQSIPRTVAPSTSALALREILFMQRFGVTEQVLRESTHQLWSKTSSLLLKLERRAALDTPLWERNSVLIPSGYWQDPAEAAAYYGSILTAQAGKPLVTLGDSFDCSAFSQYP